MPSVLSLLASDKTILAQNHRVRGSDCYVTTLSAKGKEIGTITDYTHPSLPVFIRRYSLKHPMHFTLNSPFSRITADAMLDGAVARLFEIPEGTVVFSKAKTDKETYCQLLLSQGCTADGGEITFPAGESYLLFIGGDFGACGTDSFANCIQLSNILSAFKIKVFLFS